MPLASASFAPVSTVPWELKGRERTCQDAGNGHLARENSSPQPKDHQKCLHGTSLPQGVVVLVNRWWFVSQSWRSWHLGLQGARAEEGGVGK